MRIGISAALAQTCASDTSSWLQFEVGHATDWPVEPNQTDGMPRSLLRKRRFSASSLPLPFRLVRAASGRETREQAKCSGWVHGKEKTNQIERRTGPAGTDHGHFSSLATSTSSCLVLLDQELQGIGSDAVDACQVQRQLTGVVSCVQGSWACLRDALHGAGQRSCNASFMKRKSSSTTDLPDECRTMFNHEEDLLSQCNAW
jgi:hypothetical protein